MRRDKFNEVVNDCLKRTQQTLTEKGSIYSPNLNEDRLEQFYLAAQLTQRNPLESCFGMMVKHITLLQKMARYPFYYGMEQWRETLGDIRNYTILMEALVQEMKELEQQYVNHNPQSDGGKAICKG